MIEWILAAWIVVNGQMVVDQATVASGAQCTAIGQQFIAQGQAGGFRCVFQQEV